MSEMRKYTSQAENQWCPGCPNFSILEAYKKAFVEMDLPPHRICMVSGIGQAAKLPHYLRCNFFNGLHGRALPVAVGVKTANPELTTIVSTGDGDAYGEGGNHFLHTLRRNPDITVVVHNNEIYALTKGQASPTTPAGEKRTLQVRGVEEAPLDMPAVAVLHHCTFVARGFAGEVDHLKDLLVAALKHPGLAVVDVIQPCITWGTRPVTWYRDRVRKLGDEHDPADWEAALRQALRKEEEYPIGILYQSEPLPVFGHGFRESVVDGPLYRAMPTDRSGLEEILASFRPSGVSA
ncbi:MAG: thiamine pyrophosphate-dependent enzyme [Desulfobacteraceae bacterium]|jgi:2-oxoglutarate ferredoxin oxidoreductase subunit beta